MNPFIGTPIAQPLCPVSVDRSRLAGRAPRRVWLTAARAVGVVALTWAGAAGAVDLNTATLDQLRSVRGIGAKTAQIILDERQRGGQFASFVDLSDRVRGIGPRRAQALRAAGLTIGAGSAPSTGAAPASSTTPSAGSAAHRPAAGRRP